MYIKKVVIDGFKSYGNRTEVGPFDSQFNAITGLNGTGKSNILDSICFVLGISNLSNVRASCLQDLVYKSGQAGITKATVTICFDNTNKRTSPLNYESYDEITVSRQIQIGGKNKYFINGVNVQNKRVIEFFISVQLNVNNPNFLIMQGRITKVLNMKPIEILSLIEEAAGTRSYECKKEVANKTVVKKDDKIGEMSALIEEEVAPRLDKLRADKALFLDYQKLQRDLDLYKRLYIAYRCLTLKSVISNGEKELTSIQEQISQHKNKIKSNQDRCEHIEKLLTELQENNSTGNQELKQIDADIKEQSKKEAVITVSHKASVSAIERELDNIKSLKQLLNDDKKLLESKEAVMAKADETFQKLKDADEKDSKALETAQNRLMAISAGSSADAEGNAISLQDQLIKAQENLTKTESLCKQYEMELSHYQSELREIQSESHGSDSLYKADKANLTKLDNDLKSFQNELNRMDYSETNFREIGDKQRQLNQECRAMRSRLERLRSSNQRYNFQYSDPEPGFDRRRVLGVFCRLFRPVSDHYRQALESCAASKLFNIVVDTEETGKKLLKNGNLRNRVTIIPLNKITGYCIDRTMEDFAKKLVGAGNVDAAMSVINFQEDHEPSMRYVFGSIFICKDVETANTVAFHPQIRRRCITLSGDVMDPAGTLSGGAVAEGSSVLQVLYEMDDMQYRLSEKEEELERVDGQMRALGGVAEKHTILKNRIDVVNIERQTVQRRLEQTQFHHHQQEIKRLQESIESHTNLLKECKVAHKQAAEEVKDLSSKAKDVKGYRNRELKKAEADLQLIQKKAEESRKKWQNREEEFRFMTIEISELKSSIEESCKQISKAEESMKQLQEKSDQLAKELQDSKSRSAELQQLLKERKVEFSKKNADAQKKVAEKEALLTDIDNEKLELKKSDQSLKKHEKDIEESKDKYQQFKRDHDWISEEESLFGQTGTCYDFSTHDMKEISKKITQMSEAKEQMQRNLNHKAMSALPAEESYYNGAVQKKALVESDQTWIRSTMTVLDDVKQKTIEDAYRKVNKDFGSIFSTLLPGTNAKLQPVEGTSVMDGLEVKVSFNNVWKDSLNELSGGQRSLVALSLILAMLLYKPAPLYILDEVDAALDLSHTQNIGQMLKNHFKGSQFIIVSLKEGMFNNATVLFQTRFINGMSSVIRQVQDPRKRRQDEENQAKKVLPAETPVNKRHRS